MAFSERLSDLDELILKTRTDSARKYLAEAVAAYNASAYRAAIVTTWIAVVFDVIEKINELALAEDKKAKSLLERFSSLQEKIHKGDQTAIPIALAFERQILETARDELELIDQQQFIDLDRLREDRNRCAHPTFLRAGPPYQPTAEMVRAHLKAVVAHLLEQPPLQGKAALETICVRVASEFFPRELEKAKAALLDGPFNRPSESLTRSLIDVLVKGVFGYGDERLNNPRSVIALKAVVELQRQIAEPRLQECLNKVLEKIPDEKVSFILGFAKQFPFLWERYKASDRDRAMQAIQIATGSTLIECLAYGWHVPDSRKSVEERIATLDENALAELSELNPGVSIISRAVDLYAAATSWSAANKIADTFLFPRIEELNGAHVGKILIGASSGSDLKGSHSFSKLLSLFYEKRTLPHADLDALVEKHGATDYRPKELGGLRSSKDADDEIPF